MGKSKLSRLVDKDGHCTVAYNLNTKRRYMYVKDIFTTLCEIRWRMLILFFTLCYMLSWLLFSVIWYSMAYYNGDMNEDIFNITDYTPCILNVYSFRTAFLFSLETQTTIGYGFRVVTDKCLLAPFVLVMQSIFSCFMNAILFGLVLTKVARPKKRAITLKFSKEACIAQRDGRLCFMFLIADTRPTHLSNVTIQAKFVCPRTTSEGEFIPFYSYDLNLSSETEAIGKDMYLAWPVVVCHYINAESPFYNISLSDLSKAKFEIIVLLEGLVEQTGLQCQARTSYLPSEIKWGKRFSHSITLRNDDSRDHCIVNFSEFNTLVDQATPIESVKYHMEHTRKPMKKALKPHEHNHRNSSNGLSILNPAYEEHQR